MKLLIEELGEGYIASFDGEIIYTIKRRINTSYKWVAKDRQNKIVDLFKRVPLP